MIWKNFSSMEFNRNVLKVSKDYRLTLYTASKVKVYTVLNCLKDPVGFNKIQFEAIQKLWANITRSIAQ